MNVFLVGLLGSLVGDLMLYGAVYLIYLYEKQQTKKLGDKLVNDIRNIYSDRYASKLTINNKLN